MSVTFITVIAVDNNTSDTMSRTFSTTFEGVENELMLKAMIEDWQNDIPYRRYSLTTLDYIEDYSENIKKVLEELEILN